MRGITRHSRTAPIKVLYTIPNLKTAGSRYEIYHLLRRLDRDLVQPSVGVLQSGGTLQDEIERLGVPVLQLPIAIPAAPRTSLWKRCAHAALAFEKEPFDLWHSYHYIDDYTEPIIARMAGARAWVYLKKNMSWSGRAWKARSLAATRIVARNTTMIDRFFAAPWYRSKVRYIPAGVDASLFRPDTEPRLQLRRKLGIAPHELLVGCVANLEEVKGHPTLLRAAAGFSNVRVVLAGSPLQPDYVERLHALSRELKMEDRVHMLGRVDDIPALCSELDVFVLPTKGTGRGEGFGVALTEAMACGVPCVASDIDGPRDIIASGESGVLVPPEDVPALATALKTLVNSEARRKQLGGRGRDRVLKQFTIETETAQTEALYREIFAMR